MKINLSFLSLLTLLFVGLKLTHYIDWSWWWVTAPLWMVSALWIAFVLALLVFALLAAAVVKVLEWWS